MVIKKIQLLFVFTTFFASTFITSTNAQNSHSKQLTNISTAESFYSIQEKFNKKFESYNVNSDGFYLENGRLTKASGWKQFKRWEYYWESRIDLRTGIFPNYAAPDFIIQRESTNGSRVSAGNWASLGPSSSNGGYSGLGRLNCVAFRQGDNNTFYVGSPSGGLWKTTDGGSTWIVLTDQNAVLGISDAIVIAGNSPTTDTVYIGTGDRDGGSFWSLNGGQSNDNNSIGVLKSYDGGLNWEATGLVFLPQQKVTVNRMLLQPSNNNIIYAATSDGLYQTTNAGVTWTLLSSEEFIDIEFKPGVPHTIYGSTRFGKIFLSTDAGVSWTNVIDLYASDGRRIEIAVSSNEPSWVYAVISNTSGGLNGVYKSTDSGLTYSLSYDNLNILANDCGGLNTAGQASYDLCIAADPNDADIVFIGGVNTWKSTDGGSNWSINNMWSGTCSGTAVEVHADKHFLAFQNGTSALFECNDGGIYKTINGGSNWIDISNDLIISQLYRLGLSQLSSSEVMTGLQDNGSKNLSSGIWSDVIGGDGMECLVDYTTVNTQYGESQGGGLRRTTNHWSTSTRIAKDVSGNPINGLNETGAWVMPFTIDPVNNTTLYVGMSNVWKSTNQGNLWTKISTMNSSDKIRSLVVAPSNNQVIYAAGRSTIWSTANGGISWLDITGTLPTSSSSITYISVKDDTPNMVWVSLGQYNSDGVYRTTDGGATWTNISTGLPQIPVMCVVQNKLNTDEIELYAATDVGVYVKIGENNWSLFNTGLPNVAISELEIYYNTSIPSSSKIRAATYGRGLWESDLYSNIASTIADFSADRNHPEVSQTVSFLDLSTGFPSSWSWSFTPPTVSFVGGTGASSQNPMVQFNASGNYKVTLNATNALGSDIEVKVNYINASVLQTYCSASGGGTTYISGVQIGSLSNTGTGDDSYSDYTSMSTELLVNQDYDITIIYGLANTEDDLGVWIDCNKDGDFDDTGEKVVCNEGLSFLTETYSLNVPADALLGPTTMRIRTERYDANCGNPCGITTIGEVEDYKVYILPASNTWIGYTTDWFTTSNWSEGVAPTSAFNVVIPLHPFGGNYPIIGVGKQAYCNDIFMSESAQITVNGELHVGDN